MSDVKQNRIIIPLWSKQKSQIKQIPYQMMDSLQKKHAVLGGVYMDTVLGS